MSITEHRINAFDIVPGQWISFRADRDSEWESAHRQDIIDARAALGIAAFHNVRIGQTPVTVEDCDLLLAVLDRAAVGDKLSRCREWSPEWQAHKARLATLNATINGATRVPAAIGA